MKGSNPVRILHISDIHWGRENKYKFGETDPKKIDALRRQFKKNRDKLLLKEFPLFLERLIKDKGENYINIVVVTGDIAFSGEELQYQDSKGFFEKIKDYLGLSFNDFVFCPGNHDFNRQEIHKDLEGYYDKNKISFDKTDREKLLQYITPDKVLELIKPFQWYGHFLDEDLKISRLENDYELVGEYGSHEKKRILSSIKHLYGFTKKFEEKYSIRFQIFNSCWYCFGDDRENLCLGKDFFDDSYFSDDKINISLMHHPEEWLMYEERFVTPGKLRVSMQTILDYSDLILTGHLHRPRITRHTRNGETICLNVGSTYDGIEYWNNTNIIEIDTKNRSLKYKPVYYSAEEKAGEKWSEYSEWKGPFKLREDRFKHNIKKSQKTLSKKILLEKGNESSQLIKSFLNEFDILFNENCLENDKRSYVTYLSTFPSKIKMVISPLLINQTNDHLEPNHRLADFKSVLMNQINTIKSKYPDAIIYILPYYIELKDDEDIYSSNLIFHEDYFKSQYSLSKNSQRRVFIKKITKTYYKNVKTSTMT